MRPIKEVMMVRILLLTIPLLFSPSLMATIKVVTSLPIYAYIATQIGGEKVKAEAIALPNQDPHFIRPKPSYALKIRGADLFVTTGLDLELWVPTLLDKAGKRELMEGEAGYVAAWEGIELFEKPLSYSRAGGDIHIMGNPHIYVGPDNIIKIAHNIAKGLMRVDPENRDYYQKNAEAFRNHLLVKIFGKDLIEKEDPEQLLAHYHQGKIYAYLKSHGLEGLMGGWIKKAYPLYGKEIITYHKLWVYFTKPIGLKVVGYVEPKPGIPPSLKHLASLQRLMKEHKIKTILTADYYDVGTLKRVAKKTGSTIITVSTLPNKEFPTFESLYEHWLKRLLQHLGEP